MVKSINDFSNKITQQFKKLLIDLNNQKSKISSNKKLLQLYNNIICKKITNNINYDIDKCKIANVLFKFGNILFELGLIVLDPIITKTIKDSQLMWTTIIDHCKITQEVTDETKQIIKIFPNVTLANKLSTLKRFRNELHHRANKKLLLSILELY